MVVSPEVRPEVNPEVRPPPEEKLVLVGCAVAGVVDVAVGNSFVDVSAVSKHVRIITFRRDLKNKTIARLILSL